MQNITTAVAKTSAGACGPGWSRDGPGLPSWNIMELREISEFGDFRVEVSRSEVYPKLMKAARTK